MTLVMANTDTGDGADVMSSYISDRNIDMHDESAIEHPEVQFTMEYTKDNNKAQVDNSVHDDRISSELGGKDFIEELTTGLQRGPFADGKLWDRHQGENESVGINELFETKPSSMHFPIATLQGGKTQRLRVVNVSNRPQMLQIRGPFTPNFTVRLNKKGLVAPGTSETIAVNFTASEYKYHYDTIKILTEAGVLVVPLHAYPVLNNTSAITTTGGEGGAIFPTRIDFGVCAVGDRKSRRISLASGVPCTFSFELLIDKQHPHFQIEPTEGTVPAMGQRYIVVEYAPTSAVTGEMIITVRVSQLNFKPFQCVITGSAAPGLTKKREMIRLKRRLQEELQENEVGTRTSNSKFTGTNSKVTNNLDESQGEVPLEPNEPENEGSNDEFESTLQDFAKETTTGSGHAFDAGGVWLRRQRTKKTSKGSTLRTKGMNSPPPLHDLGAELVEGLRIPGELNSVFAVNSVLNQIPGKMQPKELKEAIEKAKKDKEEQAIKQLALMTTKQLQKHQSTAAPMLSGMDICGIEETDNSHNPAQLMELAFLKDFAAAESEQREREFRSSMIHMGEPLLSSDEVSSVLSHRELLSAKQSEAKTSKERAREATARLGPSGGGALCERATLVLPPLGLETPSTVTFDLQKAGNWGRRKAVLNRFIDIVGRWIIRRRARQRLDAIWLRLGNARTRKEVRALVEADNSQAKLAPPQTLKEGGSGGVSVAMEQKKCTARLEARVVTIQQVLEVAKHVGVELKPITDIKITPEMILGIRQPLFTDDAPPTYLPEKIDPKGPPMNFKDLLAPLDMSVASSEDSEDAISLGPIHMPLGWYLEPELDRELRVGALMECGVRPPPSDPEVGWALEAANKIPITSGRALAVTLAPEAEAAELIALSGAFSPPNEPKGGENLFAANPESVRAYPHRLPFVEGSAEWDMRPKQVERNDIVTRSQYEGWAVGSTSIRTTAKDGESLIGWPMAVERLGSGLEPFSDRSTNVPVWPQNGIEGMAAAGLARGPSDVPPLSDSESEDGGDDSNGYKVPTLEECASLFTKDPIAPPGTLGPKGFKRDEAVSAWESERQTRFAQDSGVLPQRIGQIASKIANPNHAFANYPFTSK